MNGFKLLKMEEWYLAVEMEERKVGSYTVFHGGHLKMVRD